MLRTLTALSFSLFCSAALAQPATPLPAAGQAAVQSGQGAFTHQGVAREAQRYEAQLKALFAAQAQGKKGRDVRVAADKALAGGAAAAPNAMRQYAVAVVADANDADGWLGLARALLAIKPDASNGADRYELNVNSSAAAYIAYERSRSAEA